MTKLMRKLPTILAAAFLLVQVSGLAQYAATRMGARDFRAILYAVALESAIFGAAYWTRQSITYKDGHLDRRDRSTRWAALGVVILFMLASGTLNTFKTLTDLPPTFANLDLVGALIFGISPTLFAATLGVLQGFVDRLPAPPSHNAGNIRGARVYALIDTALTLINTRLDAALSATHPVSSGAKIYRCGKCGVSKNKRGQPFVKPQQVSSHARWECEK